MISWSLTFRQLSWYSLCRKMILVLNTLYSVGRLLEKDIMQPFNPILRFTPFPPISIIKVTIYIVFMSAKHFSWVALPAKQLYKVTLSNIPYVPNPLISVTISYSRLICWLNDCTLFLIVDSAHDGWCVHSRCCSSGFSRTTGCAFLAKMWFGGAQ